MIEDFGNFVKVSECAANEFAGVLVYTNGMKYIVTHTSPDWDAIGSVWLLKTYLSAWKDAEVVFVPAGQRVAQSKFKIGTGGDLTQVTEQAIEIIGKEEYIHVDTGLGPLDHHQIHDREVCGTSRTWDYVKAQREIAHPQEGGFTPEHKEAIDRIVKIITQIDHFREVYWENPTADYQEFSLLGVLEGLKLYKSDQDAVYMDFGMTCLSALVHQFENRIWAEKEIHQKGILFKTRWGIGMGFETMNDSVLKLAQKMGYAIVIRKDPRKGYVRIKALPEKSEKKDMHAIDLTLAYEKLKKIDPDATWYLHISKKMLLNGTPKNPAMVPTKLPLQQLIHILESV